MKISFSMFGDCYITNHFLTHFGRFFDTTISW